MASDKKVTETPLFDMYEYGAKRTVERTYHKGDKVYHDDCVIVVKENTIIDVEQIYTESSGRGGYWRDNTYKWGTARPMPPPPPKPTPPPKPPGFWARLFKRNRLPTATLVKG